jgi:hypothetical protein
MSATRLFHLTSSWSKARELLNEGQKINSPYVKERCVWKQSEKKYARDASNRSSVMS